MENNTTKIPTWFWVVSVIFLLWNLMGVMSFYMHTFITEEALRALPEAERDLYEQYPPWTVIAFAVAVFGGTLGSVALLMKKKWAKPLFIISFIAIIIQMYHNLFMTTTMEVYGPASVVMPILVVLIAGFLIWFSSYGIKKSWLK